MKSWTHEQIRKALEIGRRAVVIEHRMQARVAYMALRELGFSEEEAQEHADNGVGSEDTRVWQALAKREQQSS